MKLVQKYSQRDESQWGPLFHTILQSTIRDWYRRQKVRNQWRGWFNLTGLSRKQADKTGDGRGDDAQRELIENTQNSLTQAASREPAQQLEQVRSMEALERALHVLPLRQQQAFLLRVWEGMSVDDTANTMKCSAGSVKTHFSRAVHALRIQLEDYQP